MCVFKSTLNVEWGNMRKKILQTFFGCFSVSAFNQFWIVFGVRFIDFKRKHIFALLFAFEICGQFQTVNACRDSNCQQTNNFIFFNLLPLEISTEQMFKAKVHYLNTYDYEKIT